MTGKIREAGFSLVEVLIAMTVFAVGILAVATLQITSMKGNSTARRITEAAALGQGRIEELLTTEYDDLVSGSESRNGYEMFWTVTEDSALENTKTVLMEVTQGGRTVRMRYLKADAR